MLVIVIICLIGLLIGSCFGIFFSGEDSGSGYTMQNVVQEINDDYQQQIDTTKANLSHDVLEMSGSRAVWPEVLAVYAVKTTTDPDNPQEVATIDDSKKAILTDIFWEMNQISSRTETRTETVITETDDGHGNIVETESTVTQTYLYITVSHKTAEEMAEQYGFDKEQKEQLAELLAEENRQPVERRPLRHLHRGRGHRLRGALPGGERGRRAVLELVWFFRARRVVCVFRFLVCQRVRLY